MKFLVNIKDFFKNNLYNNTYVFNFLLFFMSLFSIEMIVRMINGYDLTSYAVVRIIVLLIIVCYVTCYVLNYFKSATRKIITAILVFIGSTYACLQLGFLKFLGVYASLQSASQAEAVTDYIKDFLKSFRPVFLATYIPFIVLIAIYVITKKRFYRNNKTRMLFSTLVMVALFGCVYYELLSDKSFQNPIQSIDNEELFLTASNPSLTVSEFGMFGFGMSDLRNKLFPAEVKTSLQISNTHTYANGEKLISGIDDNMWEYLINTEEDENYSFLNNYYYTRKKASVNDHTGLFKDKNLIVIMMESANDIFTEYPEYFPNIAKLVNGGWSWENYYSPRNSCATLNNEFSGMTSLYSISNTCTAKTYIDNTYFESIFNIFNDSNYYSFSAHNYTEHYYPRNQIHTNMGSNKYYGVEELGIDYDDVNYQNWSDDDDFLASVLNILEGVDYTNGNFMTWLTTVSGHQPYFVDSNQGNEYFSMTEGTPYDFQIRRYMSKLKVLDEGIGLLLQGLEEKGILDDTVIVLYGDHYPYGIDTKLLNTALSYDTEVDMNAEQVPFIIYNSEVTEKDPHIYTDYTTYVNILPTVANLFNLKYESRLYMGEDLFSPKYNSIAVFSDGSWKTEKGFYNAATGVINYYTDEEYTFEELKSINDEVNLKLKASTISVTTNYFAHIKEKIDNRLLELESLKNEACLLTDNTLYVESVDCSSENKEESEVVEENENAVD